MIPRPDIEITINQTIYDTARLAEEAWVSVSVAVLLAALISVTPAGAVIVAVLTRSPVAAAEIAATTV